MEAPGRRRGRKPLDLTGRRFGWLVVTERGPSRSESHGRVVRAQWVCRCACGNVTLIDTRRLRSGHTRSCGCRKRIRSDGPDKLARCAHYLDDADLADLADTVEPVTVRMRG